MKHEFVGENIQSLIEMRERLKTLAEAFDASAEKHSQYPESPGAKDREAANDEFEKDSLRAGVFNEAATICDEVVSRLQARERMDRLPGPR
jgi:hypothetical protein